uniref:Uncharacterized protein n=1 Tax=Chromera velia CCMP2878 TaxID=1169474 RepID=A0A0G4I283_9ALVE|mmetsp:Transcript_39778/g.78415  ORF Transcript_39778/g.78415 Transcript_39778/m.78415 type:complete len:216 (+) Transcript_39778:80-727(+)|eukprot:Cvel_10324.t1-p1 / transcript=Cvel_10324.t1 / gene=Cvel_10324 / organism=Chromera_velia_CCMP2878 / gene_product=N(6)-adenine-specific DNA methyltransferase 2, putative / transcript_product=N(6)-adenine-specific DNA methyltransferase 2, putative / location=Cvel_scaffold620:22474-25600(-) / protein_length=215 / sequence_SO=supercontig / SO=protein_coding / is_pseudo=false
MNAQQHQQASGHYHFCEATPENGDLNQYWYSPPTVSALVQEVEAQQTQTCGTWNGETANPEFGGMRRTAFLSTPSLYFSLTRAEVQGNSKFFDIDSQWAGHPGFVQFDFRKPEAIPQEERGAYDMVVIDPPFITEEVWSQYATAASMLLRQGGGGRLLLSTVAENLEMLRRVFNEPRLVPLPFKPSIPHLVYQYDLFANFPVAVLSEKNPEILED